MIAHKTKDPTKKNLLRREGGGRLRVTANKTKTKHMKVCTNAVETIKVEGQDKEGRSG